MSPEPAPRRDDDTPVVTRRFAHTDEGGDPACWLNQVCEECGRLIEDRLADACPYCGTPR